MSCEVVKTAYEKGYRITRDGTAISPSGLAMKSIACKNGRLVIHITVGSKQRRLYIHQLVAYQKFGDAALAEGIVTRHLDGNCTNNTWDNIAIGTQSQNRMDMPALQRLELALRASSFVKVHDHEAIRLRYRETKSYKQVMQEFNITSKGTLHYNLNGRDKTRKQMVDVV